MEGGEEGTGVYITIAAPSWETSLMIYFEVLRTNKWDSDPANRARDGITELAKFMDYINKHHLLKPEDVREVMEKIREVKEV